MRYYYCNNVDCKSYKDKIIKSTFKMEGGKLVSRCVQCNEVTITDHKIEDEDFGVPMISRISSMTEEEKKAALLKRSADDFRKNGEKYDQFVRQQEEAGKRYR